MLVTTLSGLAVVSKPMQIRVDHATVCGSQLDTLRESFAWVGLTPDYGGPHAHGGTQMALLGFDDGSYLELIAPQKAGVPMDSEWSKMIAGDAGPCAWATGSNNLKDDVAQLKSRGVKVDGPYPGSRTRPDGKVIAWEGAMVGPDAPGAVLPFMIEDKTPRALRVQPSASVKGSRLTGIEIVVVGVKNLDPSIALFRKAYGWDPPVIEEHKEWGVKLAYFKGNSAILATPLDESSWLAERLRKFGESPVAYLLGTQDLNAASTRFHLQAGSIWFGRKLAWFDATRLHGVRLGVVQ